MYSDRIQERLDEDGIEIGDTVRVTQDGTEYEGRLMPRSEQGDAGVLVLKLDNGYNIGVRYEEDVDLELVGEQEDSAAEERSIPDHDPDKPDVTILHTGGTIASKVSYEEGGVTAAFEPEDLLHMYPELFDRANIDSHVVAQMWSEDMEPEHWQQIAEAVADHRKEADGIIIGHGTDTMHYTAAALSFMLENIDIPVVLTGAQRSSDRPSTDAVLNLHGAATLIEEGISGVYLCMHASSEDDAVAVHHGARARKMHTSRRDAFQSIDSGPIAMIDPSAESVSWNQKPAEPDGDFVLRDEINHKVGLFKAHPAVRADVIDRFTDYDGLVIEGTGLGHLPVNRFDQHTDHHEELYETLKDISEDGIVAMSSQCINGRVNMNVYDAGVKIQDAGVVSAQTMTPETAYVKLMWALGQADSQEDAEELFQENVAGEIVEREEYDGFN